MSLSPAPGVPLSDAHREYLLAQGIHPDFLAEPHIAESLRSVTSMEELPEEFRSKVNPSAPTGILFRWQSPADPKTETWQFRPDAPIYGDSGRELKYIFPFRKGMTGTLRSVKNDGSILVAVEGTKQGLAVASALRGLTDYTVASFPGVQGWGKGGRLSPEWLALSRNRSKTFIILDADAAHNWLVYDGGARFKKALGSGRNIKFVGTPGEGSEGIDDYLAQLDDEQRAPFLLDLFRVAGPKPAPKAPPRHSLPDPADNGFSSEDTTDGDSSPSDGQGFFDPINGSINPITVVDTLLERNELALDMQKQLVYLYDAESGVYTPSIGSVCDGDGDGLDGTDTDLVVSALLMDLLGDRYASSQEPTITKALKVKLIKAGRVITQEATTPLIHFRNGWLDPNNPGILLPHSPDRPSTCGFNVDYDPDAACPEIQNFLDAATRLSDGTTQTDFILDALSQLMDWQTLPTKMLWLAGKPRAGKGTLQRLLEAIIPARMTSAVSLHALEDDPFARANLYGALLNVVGEADAKGLSNPKVAKEATGGDWIHANPKYARQFKFRNRAFWVLAANDLPTVNDPSGALHARIMPTSWDHSHVGKEDPELEGKLMQELPGFVNLILAAFLTRKARGGRFLDTNPLVDQSFKEQMNPVFRFMSEEAEITPEEHFISETTVEEDWGSTPSDVYTAYKNYADERGYSIIRNRDSLEKQLAGLGVRGTGSAAELRSSVSRKRVWGLRLKRRPTGIGTPSGKQLFTANTAPASTAVPTPLAWTYTPHPSEKGWEGVIAIEVATDGMSTVTVTTRKLEGEPVVQRVALTALPAAQQDFDIAAVLGNGTPIAEIVSMPAAYRAALSNALFGRVSSPAAPKPPVWGPEFSFISAGPTGVEQVIARKDAANYVTVFRHLPTVAVPGAVEYVSTIGFPRHLTDEDIDALTEYAELDAELEDLWAAGKLDLLPPVGDEAAQDDTTPMSTGSDTGAESAEPVQTDNPVLSRITPAAWALLRERGRTYNPSAPEEPQPPAPFDPTNAYSATAWDSYRERVADYRAQMENPLLGLENDLRQLTSTVSLAEIADALKMPVLHARAYLRAANASLAEAGITLRERRLGVEGLPGSDIAMFPDFVGPMEKQAMKAKAKALDSLIKRLDTKLERETTKLATMRSRVTTLKKDDAKARQLNAVGDQLTVVADLRIALDSATAMAEQERPDTAHLDALLPTHTGYAVALTR